MVLFLSFLWSPPRPPRNFPSMAETFVSNDTLPFLICLFRNRACGGQVCKRILKIYALVRIILTNSCKASKHFWGDCFQGIELVWQPCPTIGNFHRDVLSTFGKVNVCLPMQPHVLREGRGGSARPLSVFKLFLCLIDKQIVDILPSLLGF